VGRWDQRRGRTNQSDGWGSPAPWRFYNHSLRMLGDNEIESFRLNRLAALSGMHDAVLAMGWFYLNGIGVDANKEEAIRWYRKSARQGDERAMFSLGQICYFDGDFAGAILWFTRASDKGHHRSDYWIGKLFWRGSGVVQDRKAANAFFARAAAKKVAEAQRAVRYLAFLTKKTPPKSS
jgi:uncharacterized protein